MFCCPNAETDMSNVKLNKNKDNFFMCCIVLCFHNKVMNLNNKAKNLYCLFIKN